MIFYVHPKGVAIRSQGLNGDLNQVILVILGLVNSP